MKAKATYKQFQKGIKPYKQSIRAFLGWLSGLLLQIIPQGGYDAAITWPWKKWAFTLGVAAIPGFMGLMKGGDTNPTDEEMFEKVRAVKLAKKAAAGVETTGELPLPAPVLPKD
jgi:hypothetical protein